MDDRSSMQKVENFSWSSEALGNEFVNTCNSINQNVQLSILHSPDQQTQQIEGTIHHNVGHSGEMLNLIQWPLPQKNISYLSRIPDPVPAPSAQTSRDHSVERIPSHPQQSYDHLRPPKLLDEASPSEVSEWRERFKAWFKLLWCQNSMHHDLDFLRYTILASVEKNWPATLLSNQECKNAKIDDFFAIIDSTLLIQIPCM